MSDSPSPDQAPRPEENPGQEPVPAPAKSDPVAELGRRTRRSFLVGGLAALAGAGGWWWLGSRAPVAGQPWPLRSMLELNGWLSQLFYSPGRLSPAFDPARAREPRVNGQIGLETPLQLKDWHLTIHHPDRGDAPRRIPLTALDGLPRVEMVTELKCVEGWSEVVRWGGVRFADFIQHFQLATRSGQSADLNGDRSELYRYVALETPDQQYYVSIDVASALHPQTLLCDQMNGEPLTEGHGAPLRLVIPLKYGIKNLKRIATIRFTDQRPPDYWAERGYDWYSGH